MGFVCTRHPSHPAVQVCDRCGTTLCGTCSVVGPDRTVWCGACALGASGVRRRRMPPVAPRRLVAGRRRELSDAARRSIDTGSHTGSHTPHASGHGDADEHVPDRGPAATTDDWWDEVDRTGWSRRF